MSDFTLSLPLYSGNLCPTHGLVVLLLQVHWFCGLHLFRSEKEDKPAVHPSHHPSLHHAHLLLVWSKGGHYKPILLRLLFKMCCYAAILLVVQSLCKKGICLNCQRQRKITDSLLGCLFFSDIFITNMYSPRSLSFPSKTFLCGAEPNSGRRAINWATPHHKATPHHMSHAARFLAVPRWFSLQ